MSEIKEISILNNCASIEVNIDQIKKLLRAILKYSLVEYNSNKDALGNQLREKIEKDLRIIERKIQDINTIRGILKNSIKINFKDCGSEEISSFIEDMNDLYEKINEIYDLFDDDIVGHLFTKEEEKKILGKLESLKNKIENCIKLARKRYYEMLDKIEQSAIIVVN